MAHGTVILKSMNYALVKITKTKKHFYSYIALLLPNINFEYI